MYLCLCNGLTERKVRCALADHCGHPTVSDAYRACGCTARCGACAAEMRDAVNAERARRSEARLGAD